MSATKLIGQGPTLSDPNRFLVHQSAHGHVPGKPLRYIITSGGWISADGGSLFACHGVVSSVVDSNTFWVQLQGPLTLTTAEWDAVAGTSGGLVAGTWYVLYSAGTYTSGRRVDPEQRILLALSTTTAMVVIEEPHAFYLSPRVVAWGRWEANELEPTTTDRNLSYTIAGSPQIEPIYAAGRAGILEVGNGVLANQYTIMGWGLDSAANTGMGPGVASGQVASVRFTWNIPSLGTAVRRLVLYAGWADSWATSPGGYALFGYQDSTNSGMAFGNTGKSGTTGVINGTTTILANTWYRSRVELSATDAKYYLNSTGIVETLEATESTSGRIPNDRPLSPVFWNYNNGGSTPAQLMVLLDRMEWELYVP